MIAFQNFDVVVKSLSSVIHFLGSIYESFN